MRRGLSPGGNRILKKLRRTGGARTVNGLGMLACQGALNFTLWTGVEAPLTVMEEKLRMELEKQ